VVGPFTLGVTNSNPLTMAGAYATFAARGVFCEPRPVTEVLNSNGKPVQTYPEQCKQLLPTPVADAVNDVLRGVQEPGGFGYGAGINLSQPSAGKTGTINRNMAVWFVGYTPQITTAAMVAGANSEGHWVTLNGQTVGGTYISEAFGSTVAGPVWGDAMAAISGRLDYVDFQVPASDEIAGVLTTVPSVTGMTLEQAQQTLEAAGFAASVGGSVNSSIGEGLVAYTSPASGESVSSGDTVTIYQSTGYVPPPPQPAQQGDGDGGPGGGGDDGDGGGGNSGRGNGNGRDND
jgi:membrane peptidoglycan carboxypeptidase